MASMLLPALRVFHSPPQIRAEFTDLIGSDNLEHFPEWIRDDDPQVVHRLLHALCDSIIIHPDRTIEIDWRA